MAKELDLDRHWMEQQAAYERGFAAAKSREVVGTTLRDNPFADSDNQELIRAWDRGVLDAINTMRGATY